MHTCVDPLENQDLNTLLSLLGLKLAMLGDQRGFAADFNRRGMVRELGNHDLTLVQLLGVVETRVLSTGQPDDLHAVLLCLDNDIITTGWMVHGVTSPLSWFNSVNDGQQRFICQPVACLSGISSFWSDAILPQGHTTISLKGKGANDMKYDPAPLSEEHVHKLRELERQFTEVTGEPLVLVAYAPQAEDKSKLPDSGR